MFESIYLENAGDNGFIIRALPNEAQISPIFGIVPFDWNHDGHLDFLTAGNYYEREVETMRSDSGIGNILLGNGTGEFSVVSSIKTGMKAYKDVRDVKVLKDANSNPLIIIANNNDYLDCSRSVSKPLT